MHLGNTNVTPACAIFGISVATVSLGLAYLAARKAGAPQPWKIAAGTSLVFTAQMFNVGVLPGTQVSGHMIGAVLLAHLLSPAWAVLAVSLVLGVQSAMVGDGGWMTLGLNVLNMAVIPAAVVYPLWKHLFGQSTGLRRDVTLAIAAWLSVVLAAGAGAIELLSRSEAREQVLSVLGLMLGTHALIGAVEAAGTLAAIRLVERLSQITAVRTQQVLAAAAVLVMVPAALVGASPFPDGLEFTLDTLNLGATSQTISLFADYSLLPALLSVVMLAVLSLLVTKLVARNSGSLLQNSI